MSEIKKPADRTVIAIVALLVASPFVAAVSFVGTLFALWGGRYTWAENVPTILVAVISILIAVTPCAVAVLLSIRKLRANGENSWVSALLIFAIGGICLGVGVGAALYGGAF